jgi:hypothetical protein
MFILYLILAYLFIGFLFALIFLGRLIHNVDEGSIGAPWTFKLIIFPGCVVFWPVLLRKYLMAVKSDHHD